MDTDVTVALGRARWDALRAYAQDHGVSETELLRIVRRTLGKFQPFERITEEQARWARGMIDRSKQGGLT